MGKNNFSRRGFLTGASAAAALSGCSSPAPESAAASDGGVWERPPDQRGKGNRRNLIFLTSDTFRADNLACYGGNGLVHCPRLDEFSKDCVVFDRCYPEGMPTIPIRRVIMTGRRIVPYYSYHQHEPVQLPGWHELYYEDQTISETLTEAGYATALIADLPHMQRPGKNFHRGFGYYEWSRGHEADSFEQAPFETPQIVPNIYPQDYWDRLLKVAPSRPDFMRQYLANRSRYEKECEAVVEKTAKQVIGWLDRNHDKTPFYLHVESFDPHEPWDPPKRFLDEYLPNASGPTWWEPPYADIEVPEEGVRRLRANYAGEAMCVDFWMGEILKKVDELGLFDTSVVAFFSDHGALLGEQGQFVKGPERLRRQVTHNPFLVRLPGGEHAGTHVDGFIQHPDVMPTLFNLLELNPPPRATGRNLWDMVTGGNSPHEFVVHAYGWIGGVRTREWAFSTVFDQQRYGREYPSQLYDLAKDPDELTNVAEQHPNVVADLTAKMRDYIESGREITRGTFHAKADVQPA